MGTLFVTMGALVQVSPLIIKDTLDEYRAL